MDGLIVMHKILRGLLLRSEAACYNPPAPLQNQPTSSDPFSQLNVVHSASAQPSSMPSASPSVSSEPSSLPSIDPSESDSPQPSLNPSASGQPSFLPSASSSISSEPSSRPSGVAPSVSAPPSLTPSAPRQLSFLPVHRLQYQGSHRLGLVWLLPIQLRHHLNHL